MSTVLIQNQENSIKKLTTNTLKKGIKYTLYIIIYDLKNPNKRRDKSIWYRYYTFSRKTTSHHYRIRNLV